jgi:transposase
MKPIATTLGRELRPGIAASLEQAIRFADWARDMGDRLTAASIKDHFGCSRATSYRWLSAYRAARAAVEDSR